MEELAESHEFKSSTGNGVKSNRMRDRYLILRFISFYLYFTDQIPNIDYRSDIDGFLANAMRFINNQADQNLIEQIKGVCLFGMRNAAIALGENGFRFAPKKTGGNKRPVNMGLFEMLVFSFCYIGTEHLNDRNTKKIIDEQKNLIDEMDLLAGSIDTTKHVHERFDIAQKIIQRINHA